ncbi:MAG: transporter, partial [Candidatus Rokubacteria bacterium]|nr:transporter [Candidatus Rokubacteria bacterium]
MRQRIRMAMLLAAVLALGPAPAWAGSGCDGDGGLRQQARRPPQADPRPYQPVNGTGGFSVFGANTVGAGTLSVGVGYLGEAAVCQQLEGVFDLNTVWLALAYGITDRLQLGVDVPYTWYEADKTGADGSGIDDLNLGLVFRLLDEAPGRPGVALVGFAAAPTGERSEGLGRNEWDLGAKLALSKTLPGGLLGHVSAGYTYVGRGRVDQDDEFTSGVALEWPLGRYVSLVAEGLANTNRRDGALRKSDWVAETRAGFRVRWAGFLLSLAGRKGLTNDAPDWGVFALLTYSARVGPGAAAAAAPTAAPPPGA